MIVYDNPKTGEKSKLTPGEVAKRVFFRFGTEHHSMALRAMLKYVNVGSSAVTERECNLISDQINKIETRVAKLLGQES